MHIKYLMLDWWADYECPGGDCGLTCCSAEWTIRLQKEEIEKYQSLNHSFRTELLSAIDEEHECIRCLGDVCQLLDDDGFCKLVRNCGKEYLSNTCDNFPRRVRYFGDTIEALVEIVCPIVAENLLNLDQMQFLFSEKDEDLRIEPIDYRIYDGMSRARSMLIETMQIIPGEYTYGKMYIMYDIYYKVMDLLSVRQINTKSVQEILDQYCELEYKAKLFTQYEIFGQDIHAKATVIHNTLLHLNEGGSLGMIMKRSFEKRPFLESYVKEWLNDEPCLCEDLFGYILFMRESYPMFTEKYFTYVLFADWIQLERNRLQIIMRARNLEFLLIQISGMALWKYYGQVDKKLFSILIAEIDRKLTHVKKGYEMIDESCIDLPCDDIRGWLLLLIG